MNWIRRNSIVLLVLFAVSASFVLARLDAESASDQQREDNVALCILANERGALVAAYQRRTADARRATGDIAVANGYDAFARGSEENLAIARYIENPLAAAQVVKVDSENGPVYRLTADSKALIRKGCERTLRD